MTEMKNECKELSDSNGSASDPLLIQAIKVASHRDTEPPKRWVDFAICFRKANKFLPNYRDKDHYAAYTWFCGGYESADQNTELDGESASSSQ